MILRTFVEGGKALALRRRAVRGASVLELVLGNVVLLSSAALETEREFGRLAALGLDAGGRAPRVLVGGLGFGSTLRGVLDVAPSEARIVVAEKLEAVVDVARNEARELTDGALDDPRVTLAMTDVASAIAEGAESPEAAYSAILLDVDNGPDWASFRSNARLYADTALLTARRALRPGGIFSVWSGYPADAFVARLRRAGFTASVAPLHERGVVRARAYVGRAPDVAAT